MAGKIQFTLNGEAQEFAGKVTGKGSLKMETDATTLAFALDYKSKDKIILTLSGTQGIKLSASDKLKFSGSVSREMVNQTWTGEYALKLEISKTVAAQLSQEFTKKGTKTSAEITIKF
jgi:phage replication-related protein YjqB (UPF0714/DUF867 family)